jgi:2-succinyl-5-enolpyruvyl-6-hydroxy-3-cyclohexene-1-carboxylate synthase
MPIRDLDTFFFCNDKNIRIMANRGANGIDGVVSTALGASTVPNPLILVIGDLSFYHDLNGLLAAKLHQLNITIILINNDGGGIFSFLPQAGLPRHFETLFGTPIGLDFIPGEFYPH